MILGKRINILPARWTGCGVRLSWYAYSWLLLLLLYLTRMNGTGLRHRLRYVQDWNEWTCLFVAGLENLAHWWFCSSPWWNDSCTFLMLTLYHARSPVHTVLFIKPWVSTSEACFRLMLSNWRHGYAHHVSWAFLLWLGPILWWSSRWRVWFGFPMETTSTYTIHAFLMKFFQLKSTCDCEENS